MHLVQFPPYILDIYNGIVNERAYGYRQAAKAHGVDTHTQQVENEQGCKQTDGDGNNGDDRRADIPQKQGKHYDNEYRSLYEGIADIVYRTFDETRLPEYVGRDMYVLRQVPGDIFQGSLKGFRQLQSASGRLLGNGQQNRRLASFRGHAELWFLGTYPDLCYVGYGDRHSVHRLHQRA